MINAEIICHHDLDHVSFPICHMLQKSSTEKMGDGLDQYRNDMPPWIPDFHVSFPISHMLYDHNKKRGGEETKIKT